MTKRLHGYISRELGRVTALALAGLTLLMTIVVVLEPLRKEGLSMDQALRLVVTSLPYVLALTLPVASLFAATIVYGRMAQDNEWLACRANGIATLSLMKPALMLGALVTVLSLLLNNYVAPGMLQQAQSQRARYDARKAMFQQLQTRGYLRAGQYHLHADVVDPDTGMIAGFVAVDSRRPNDLSATVASRARVDFFTDEADGQLYVRIDAKDPAALRSAGFGSLDAKRVPVEVPVETIQRDKPAWYNWNRLIATLKNPSLNIEIARMLADQRRRVMHDLLLREVKAAIDAGKAYNFRRGSDSYELTALSAQFAAGRLSMAMPVLRRPDGNVAGESGVVAVDWSRLQRQSLVSIVMSREGQEIMGAAELPLPQSVAQQARNLALEDLTVGIRAHTSDPDAIKAAAAIQTQALPDLARAIAAEMHARVSYGSSCFIMVALGAALGLMFRGGHFISAFALSMIPATIVIVMLLMGKELMRNREIDLWMGLTATWGGIALLLAMTIGTYVRLGRT